MAAASHNAGPSGGEPPEEWLGVVAAVAFAVALIALTALCIWLALGMPV
jgi:hypothetical protein